ncbi:MAG: hypothetical protein JW900_06260 [Anaerolineae bacterium]|nr:hypothetical protein [Anaerolineae bacterium]
MPEESGELAGGRSDRLAHLLTLLLLVASGGVVFVYLLIAINPFTPLNPFPPATPTAVATRYGTPTAVEGTPTGERPPTITSPHAAFVSPTPLRPITPTAAPGATMPFSATVQVGRQVTVLDCRQAILAGTVVDAAGEPLIGYPVHVWGPGEDTIAVSGDAPAHGPSGWEVASSGMETGTWYVQLHSYNVYRAHPPFSPFPTAVEHPMLKCAIVEVSRARRFP